MWFAGCRTNHAPAKSLGEAFVGPAVLKLRSDIPLESPVVATLKHGDRVEIIQKRRRFLRVRAANGAEGWTHERQLLAASDMTALEQLFQQAAHMPAQGAATVYDALNIHTRPSSHAPSFLQIHEGQKVDVLTHAVMPRTEESRPPLVRPTPKQPRKTAAKKEEKAPRYPPLRSPPEPPGPPAGWLELSKTAAPDAAPPQEPKKEEKPVPTDDWSLVRTPNGEAGWALTRRLVMAIPDEVAQYAEGRRIVSYFSLGEVQDGNLKKHNWLWTTISDGTHPYDFDSFRVFIWSIRRHRFETAYIERRIEGYAPVIVKPVQLPNGKNSADSTTYPGFSLCVEGADGHRYRKEYAFLTNIVRFAGQQPCEPPPALQIDAPPPAAVTTRAEKPSLYQRFRRRLRAMERKWFGR
ncbi:MAG TPA: SH3 domain-containing protein [Bryobacteraceae bacterium]|nr:SH3 domain-containing protein [Bryobacteraceae bacterium]